MSEEDDRKAALDIAQKAVMSPATYSKPVDWTQRKLSPLGLYSHASEVAAKMPMKKGTPEQIKGYLLKQGVKPDEIKHSGFDEWAGRNPIVTREQMAQHFHFHQPKLEEKVLTTDNPYPYKTGNDWQNAIFRAERAGNFDEAHRLTTAWEAAEGHGGAGSTKHGKWVLPGGENYREALLTVPEKPATSQKIEARVVNYGVRGHPVWTVEGQHNHVLGQYGADHAAAVRHAAQVNEGDFQRKMPSPDTFRSSHWDEPNVLLHRRLTDRTDPKTKAKILHLEELQSDWGQQGREKGFREPKENELAALVKERDELATDRRYAANAQREAEIDAQLHPIQARIDALGGGEPGVPYHPLIANTSKWLDLGLKRTLMDAAKGGYDKLVWTPGQEQADRYDLSKHVDKVSIVPTSHDGKNPGSYRIDAFKNNEKVLEHFAKDEKEIASVVGKDVAKRLLDNRNQHGAATVAGEQLKVGGSGMLEFYDKMLPQALLKLAKRHDPEAALGTHELPGGQPMSSDEIEKELGQAHGYWSDLDRSEQEALQKKYKRKGTSLPSLDITPKMRESILKGLPTFSQGGEVDEPEHDARGGAVHPEVAAIEKIAPNRRTIEQVRRHAELTGLIKPKPLELAKEVPKEPPILNPMPRAEGGRAAIVKQIGDFGEHQKSIAATDDTIKKALDLIEGRPEKAEGGTVAEPPKPDATERLLGVVERQGKMLNDLMGAVSRLNELMAAPQVVKRDGEGKVKEIRRVVKKPDSKDLH